MTTLREAFDRQREEFLRHGPPSAELRRGRIDLLLSVLLDNAEQLSEAISADFGGRARVISMMNDVLGSLSDVEHTRTNLAKWMKPRPISRTARVGRITARLQPDPLGVVGVIAPWNFPLHLAVLPAASALAAGNRVMIKMSEKAPRTAELFAELVSERFDDAVLRVVTGGVEVGSEFCGLPFDHLLFTGAPEIGAKIMARAAEQLVPVTLELGGKNPAVVARDADFEQAAVRLARARLTNGGQVCLCPEYALVPTERVDEFVALLAAAVRQSYPTVLRNPLYTGLIDEPAFDRVLALIADASARGAEVTVVTPPGEALPDRASRKVAPTIITNVTSSMRISSEEVFGPVLTVHGYDETDDAIDFVNAGPEPLTAYWYGPDSADFTRFTSRTRSGGVSRNDFALHAALPSAPFGGVGRSGIGSYHGKFGFDTFSHLKPIVGSDLPMGLTTSQAAFGPLATKMMTALLKRRAATVRRRLALAADAAM